MKKLLLALALFVAATQAHHFSCQDIGFHKDKDSPESDHVREHCKYMVAFLEMAQEGESSSARKRALREAAREYYEASKVLDPVRINHIIKESKAIAESDHLLPCTLEEKSRIALNLRILSEEINGAPLDLESFKQLSIVAMNNGMLDLEKELKDPSFVWRLTKSAAGSFVKYYILVQLIHKITNMKPLNDIGSLIGVYSYNELYTILTLAITQGGFVAALGDPEASREPIMPFTQKTLEKYAQELNEQFPSTEQA